MKKLMILLLAALLALTAALAEAPQASPEPNAEETTSPEPEVTPEPQLPVALPERSTDAGEGIELELEGERVTLGFDTSKQYSSIENGLVQASFYSYSADGAKLYELYLIFPDTVQRGMVITPDYAALTGEECSVVLIVSDTATQEELYYFTSLMSGQVYPENSSFTIAIDDVTEVGGATTFSGTLSATLIALNMATGEARDTLQIPETPFRFTIGDGSGERHDAPLPTEKPADNDMRKT